MNKEEAKNQLCAAEQFDAEARDALAALIDKHELTMTDFTGVLSAMTWQLRDMLPPECMGRTEIVAAFLCKMRGVDSYPLAGMK